MALRPRHAKTFRNSSSSHKIDYVPQVEDIINVKGHHNHIIGTAILMNRLILPIDEVASGRVCGQPAKQAY